MNKAKSFFLQVVSIAIVGITTCLNTASAQQFAVLPAHLNSDYNVPEKAETQLRDKMLAALSSAGLATTAENATVALVPSISILNEQTGAGVQNTVSMTLNYTFSLVGIASGVVFDSYIVEGVQTRGQNKINAVARSFAGVNLNTPAFQAFLSNGQSKIVAYYQRQLQKTLAKAQTNINAKQYDDALAILMEIPEETPGYTTKVLPMVERTYKMYANNLAASLLQQAQAAWAAAPDEEGAERVAEILSEMPVGTTSSAAARQLVKEIEARVKALDQRRWAAMNAALAREHQERMSVIKAARDVAVAQAKRPIRVVQHVHLWW
nr:hypothetical protein [uncultured Prevotella sp.]